jgi:hypothetical protein
MNPQPNSLKLIALLLSLMVLVQGCYIYQNKPSSLDSVVHSGTRVKVDSNNSKKFEFVRLVNENGQIYGFAHWSTKTAKTLSDQIVAKPKNSMYVKIKLDDNQIHEVYEKDKSASTISTLSVILALAGLIIHTAVNYF